VIGIGVVGVIMNVMFNAAQYYTITHQVMELTQSQLVHNEDTRKANEFKLLMDSFEQPEREVLRFELLKIMSTAVQDIAKRAQVLEGERRRLDASERVRSWQIEGSKTVVLPPGRYEINKLPEKK